MPLDLHFNTVDQDYWMGARTHNAIQGRFRQIDPMPGQDGITDTAYAYASNDPVNRVDLDGQQSVNASWRAARKKSEAGKDNIGTTWYWDDWSTINRYGNGCTSSQDAYWALNKRASFRPACAWHDQCYSSEYNWKFERKACDRAAKSWWQASCSQVFKGARWWAFKKGCRTNRTVAYQVVRRLGGSYYHGGGKNN